MRQIVESSWISLNKVGEELCGDSVIIRNEPDLFLAVLSDGLGSGVKANILSTLTVEIAARMFEYGAPVEEVIQTLAETLPECSVRKLAYATFAVLTIHHGTQAHLVEFDSAPLILIRNQSLVKLPMEEREINGKKIREVHFGVRENDIMALITDGYEHAGLGGIYPLGWRWDNVVLAVQRFVQAGIMDTYTLTNALSRTCLKLYDDKPGDDATVIGMKVRPAVYATVLTGPPANKNLDKFAVSRLMDADGEKIICGGSTAQMAARVLDRKLVVDWAPPKKRQHDLPKQMKGIPPIAFLKGIDLVTEGILTLGQASQILRSTKTIVDLPHDDDGSSRLARSLLTADEVHFIVGTAINPNQVADIIRGEPMRMVYIRELVEELSQRGKHVTVEKV